jgi:hypothetical protein
VRAFALLFFISINSIEIDRQGILYLMPTVCGFFQFLWEMALLYEFYFKVAKTRYIIERIGYLKLRISHGLGFL